MSKECIGWTNNATGEYITVDINKTETYIYGHSDEGNFHICLTKEELLRLAEDILDGLGPTDAL